VAAQLLDEWCGGWKLVSWELAEEQMFVVAKDESGGPVKARGVVIIAAVELPHLRAYFHLHLLGHASHFILFCLLISRSLNGDHGACVSLINSPMTAQLQDAISTRAQTWLLRRPMGYQPRLNAEWNLSWTHRQIIFPVPQHHDLPVKTIHLLPSNFAIHAA